MLEFVISSSNVVLTYKSDQQNNGWAWHELLTHDFVTLSRVFTFQRRDLVSEPDEAERKRDFETFRYEFRFAERRDGYFHINGQILGIDNPVLIADEGIKIERRIFVAERNISIFGKIAALVAPSQAIVVGGNRADAIPIPDFRELLNKFPNTGELSRYAAARVATIVGDYIAPLKDARAHYEAYLNRRRSVLSSVTLAQTELLKTEIEKYVLIRDTISGWLRNGTTRSEGDWQRMIVNFLLLIFPKYVAVLSNVKIADAYSTPGATRDRFIDLALIDAAGNIDVIEIKKPFDDALMGRTRYRDNYIPTKELSGSIMQAEKYLFHLSKWGLAGEKALTQRHGADLPPGMGIRVTSPKALIILGRDRKRDGSPALDARQQLDLEIIKRKYANMIDILTYDDLLRRLDNIIASLRKRAAAPAPTAMPATP
ncbi:Shedu immune nuclease family protein [Reyranella massiliensis]|uniref:Shedu immune nuclease family protein n=1 Tax=Reyranella massiliensis TaxID=445220 RepID=UPI00030B9ED1|nr:Shedu immune nuclease family protein [Reyranella massiliensis]